MFIDFLDFSTLHSLFIASKDVLPSTFIPTYIFLGY